MTKTSIKSATASSASSVRHVPAKVGIKHYRRIATRYDKLLSNFIAAVKLAAIHIWLR